MITRKAEYAIASLTELARQEKGEQITTREIARRQRIPANLIVQLISTLREAGLVDCTRGPSGGVRLAGDAAEISLRRVIELMDGPIGITRCLLRDGPCHDQVDCALRGVWARAQGRMLEVLEGVTIADLAKAKKDKE